MSSTYPFPGHWGACHGSICGVGRRQAAHACAAASRRQAPTRTHSDANPAHVSTSRPAHDAARSTRPGRSGSARLWRPERTARGGQGAGTRGGVCAQGEGGAGGGGPRCPDSQLSASPKPPRDARPRWGEASRPRCTASCAVRAPRATTAAAQSSRTLFSHAPGSAHTQASAARVRTPRRRPRRFNCTLSHRFSTRRQLARQRCCSSMRVGCGQPAARR
jgi:hypothetical protein